jgi:hypothetical protein
MERKRKNIDKLFHSNLEERGEQPPAFIWDNIADALDDAAETTRITKLKKRTYYGIALLVITMIGTTVLLLNTTHEYAEKKMISAQPVQTEKTVSVNSGTAMPAYKDNFKKSLIENTAAPVQHAMLFHPKEQESMAFVAETPANTTVENQASLLETTPLLFVKQETVSTEIARPVVSPVYAVSEKNSTASVAKSVQTRRRSRFSVSVFFAPDITTRNLEQDLGSTRDEKKEEMVQTEKNGALDFTFGGRVEYQLNKHLSLLSGISFSTNTIDIAKKTVFARYDKKDGSLKYRFNMSSGYCFFKPKKVPAPTVLGDSTEVISSSSTLHYVNIPLAMKYNFPSGRFNFFMQAGITARFITKQSISAVYAFNGEKEKNTSTQINGLKTNYFNGSVGIGADYAINPRLAITLSPIFNFATSSINEEAPVKAYPNTISIATGIKFRL